MLSGGSWSSVQVVESFSAPDMSRIVIDGAGNMFVIWYSYGNGQIFSKARVSGTLESTVMLSRNGYRSKFPAIAVNGGSVYAVFTEKTNDYTTVYCRRDASPNAGWSYPSNVYVEYPWAHQLPDVAVDSSGSPHVVTIHVLPDDSANAVAYAYWTGGGFSSFHDLSGWTATHFPTIRQKGSAMYVCWQEGGGTGGHLYFRSGSGSSWGTPA